uniref:Extracellular calcium-sensing receptor-like n=1 Tax=Callorhinchus milii TaxID=7868 RepID=A0A4W3GNW8_CALMI
MLCSLSFHFTFFLVNSVLVKADNVCELLGKFNLPALVADSDITIGGLFPIHFRVIEPNLSFQAAPELSRCEGLNFRAFRWVQTMIFTIDEINRDPRLLPNITLGYRIFDSCDTHFQALRAALTINNGQEASVTDYDCAPSIYFSTCACLSDKQEYPTFLRTVPSDYYQVRALAQLVKYFGWTWVGTIAGDDDYGHYGIQMFSEQVKTFGVCIAFSEIIPKVNSKKKVVEIVEMIEKSRAKVILVFAVEQDMELIVKEAIRQNITGVQWIASEAWVTSALLSSQDNSILIGTLGFALRRAEISGLQEFLHKVHPFKAPQNPIVTEFWETLFHCYLGNDTSQSKPSCTGLEDLKTHENIYSDVSQLRVSYSVYKGVYAVAHALHHLFACQPGQELIVNDTCPNTVNIEPEGQPICCFDCIPCADGEISNTTVQCIKCDLDYWSNSQNNQCILKEIEFLSFGDAIGISLATIALLGTGLTITIAAVFTHYRTTPVVRANNSELSFLILFSLALCFMCSLIFIGQPSVWSCSLCNTLSGVSFALCVSCILAKTIVVLMAFKATGPNTNTMKWFGPMQQRAFILLCTCIQISICVSWLITSPPLPVKNTTYQSGKIILECAIGSVKAFAVVLGYVFVLSSLCLVLAYFARKLPDNFNEAKFITFSMLIFFAVWITFIPAYVSTPGKYTVAVEIFAILSSSFGLLLCIFAPKCYIILFKPERNTKKHLMGTMITDKTS